MATSRAQQAKRIDALMEKASTALAERDYFACEKLSTDALRRAHAILDFDRMARIVMPLQEAKRQIRDIAFDANHITIVDDELPTGAALKPGCYLVQPPRVGIDGRALRERLEQKKVPGIVVVREPRTRLGYWPIVSVGNVTIRIKVDPPDRDGSEEEGNDPTIIPSREWFVETNEEMGDAALSMIAEDNDLESVIEGLMDGLSAVPDHEILHQRLAEYCHAAAKQMGPVT